MHALAIDPGQKTGGALWPAGRDPIAFALHKPTAAQIYAVIRWATSVCGDKPLLVAEGQFLGRGPRANPQTTLDIARAAERWLTIGELLGLPREQPLASRWRGPLIAGVDGKDVKARTRAAVSRLWPQVLLGAAGLGGIEERLVETANSKACPQDSIDALGMVYWAMVYR